MLYLIGLGLNDEKDLTLKAVEIAKKAEQAGIDKNHIMLNK